MMRALAGTARSELRLSYSGEGVPDAVRGLPHHLLALASAAQLQLENTAVDEAGEQDPIEQADSEGVPHTLVRASRGQVDAAKALIRADRFRRRPEKRVLEVDEEVGLAQLTRGEDGPLAEVLPPGFRATLEPDDQRAVAFDTMVAHNLGLAHSVSRKYAGFGLDEEDLFQHGLIGLFRAVERFDATRGHKFSTYATHWLKQSMRRGLADEGRTIRLPNHKHEQVRKVQAVRARLHGIRDEVTVAEISREADLPASVVVECLRLAQGTFSLDAPVAEDLTLNDLFIDRPDHSSDPDLVLDARSTSRLVYQAVRMLDARLARVIGLRFGLDGGEPLTLEEIGQLVGVSRERIRQVEKKAKEQLGEILTKVVTASGETVIQVSPPAEPRG
ncbi:RNA polymerase sigma factor RpoD/SigA, partial [Streptomyces sp. NPDC000931]|uniref:sigma-70 family RNA polymerase sigma factor n=1 Tax=Streptomyces sp. NPDC000931 TaxID=3154372 RepID=UPI00332DC9BA